jgi:hypothetical protein
VKIVDVDLRHRPAAGALHHRPPQRRIEVDAEEVDGGDAFRLEEPLGLMQNGQVLVVVHGDRRRRISRLTSRVIFSTGSPRSFQAR